MQIFGTSVDDERATIETMIGLLRRFNAPLTPFERSL